MSKRVITLDAMMAAVKEKVTGDFDLVVGIERGGVLPACLASRWLNLPLTCMNIRFRDDGHRPTAESPQLLRGLSQETKGLRILLVDDVCKTGATLSRAEQELTGAAVNTMVIFGPADISLFGPHDQCIHWPWDRE